MMKKSFLLIIMCSYVMVAFSQNNVDSIKSVRFNNRVHYEQKGIVLNAFDLKDILYSKRESYGYYQQAETLSNIANGFMYAGGFLIGYPIGYSIAKGSMNWSIFAIGCGSIILGIPISIASNHKLKVAINAYNSSVKPKTASNQMHLNLSCTQNGVGLTLTL